MPGNQTAKDGWSRDPEDLLPDVQPVHSAWVTACLARGIHVLTYCTWRSAANQDALYAVGRTVPGRTPGGPSFGPGAYVTMARGWESEHQYRIAWDAVPMLNGKPDWTYTDAQGDGLPDERHWLVMTQEAARLGVHWAGHWRQFREYVHWSYPIIVDRTSLRDLALAHGQARGQVG